MTYIRHYWSSVIGPTRERELFQSNRSEVKSKQAAVDLATRLETSSQIYAALLNPAHDLWNEYGDSARGAVQTLLVLRMEQLRPLLLAAVQHLPAMEVPKVLKLLVSWSVRFLTVGGLGGGTMERYYALRAKEIRDGKIKMAGQLATAMANVVPTDGQFQEAFETARVSQNYLARYYLRALELQAKGVKDPELVPNPDAQVVRC